MNYFQLKTRKYQRYTVAIIITKIITMMIIIIVIINIDNSMDIIRDNTKNT